MTKSLVSRSITVFLILPGVTELALNWAFVAKIWVPDTFIVNGKKSYLHKITVPNKFIRISPNGRVSYSQVSVQTWIWNSS